MKVYALSDLHIESRRDPMYSRFLGWLTTYPQSGDTVVLMGDIFDFLMGYTPHFQREYAEFFEQLQALIKSGVRVHYIEGNHDFHLKWFFAKTGVEVHHSRFVLEYDGNRYLFAHGDLVDSFDFGYLLLRFLLRSPVVKILAPLVKDSIILKIGEVLSVSTKSFRENFKTDHQREYEARIRVEFRNYACDFFKRGFRGVFLGHCHVLDHFEVLLEGKRHDYVNVGFPKIHRKFAMINGETGASSIEDIPMALDSFPKTRTTDH